MPRSNDKMTDAREALRKLDDWALDAGIMPSTYTGPDSTKSPAARRRARRAGKPDPVGLASLVMNDEGILLWHIGGGVDRSPAGRRQRRLRRGVPRMPDGEIVQLYHYDKLDPNEINTLLVRKDAELNPHHGLRKVELNTKGKLALGEEVRPSGKKRRLLFIHGTFSKSEAFFDGIGRAAGGAQAIAQLLARYDEVLAFDHPTLSVSPVMNAFDLARLLAGSEGPLDVIAHSRGGLVARWLLDGFGLNGVEERRAVLVGSPLNGTSLASPPQLRNALSALTNYGNALKSVGEVASVWMPFMQVPLLLLHVVTTVLSVTAKTPIADAAIAMVPGLQGQSRIGDHPELKRLRAVRLARPTQYFLVQSNFETEDAGWKFWKWFRKDKILDSGADLVFPGANDLVVDTNSMIDIPGALIDSNSILDFGTSDVVHHTNYFAQPDTLDFILARLK